jgi:hypothetical protein
MPSSQTRMEAVPPWRSYVMIACAGVGSVSALSLESYGRRAEKTHLFERVNSRDDDTLESLLVLQGESDQEKNVVSAQASGTGEAEKGRDVRQA